MDRCPGCGGMVTTGGCVNADCALSMGGTYVDGKKTATASGRPLVGPGVLVSVVDPSMPVTPPIDIPSIMRAGGFKEGVKVERARIVALLRAEAEDHAALVEAMCKSEYHGRLRDGPERWASIAIHAARASHALEYANLVEAEEKPKAADAQERPGP